VLRIRIRSDLDLFDRILGLINDSKLLLLKFLVHEYTFKSLFPPKQFPEKTLTKIYLGQAGSGSVSVSGQKSSGSVTLIISVVIFGSISQ
jgi:hypothetical protein